MRRGKSFCGNVLSAFPRQCSGEEKLWSGTGGKMWRVIERKPDFRCTCTRRVKHGKPSGRPLGMSSATSGSRAGGLGSPREEEEAGLLSVEGGRRRPPPKDDTGRKRPPRKQEGGISEAAANHLQGKQIRR